MVLGSEVYLPLGKCLLSPLLSRAYFGNGPDKCMRKGRQELFCEVIVLAGGELYTYLMCIRICVYINTVMPM